MLRLPDRLIPFIKPNDFWLSIFFGLISLLFSFIEIKIPNLENVYSNLYEIPLLISLLYLRNPLWILLINAIAALSVAQDSIYFATILMHFLPHLAMWKFFMGLTNKNLNSVFLGIVTMFSIGIYYFVLLIPNIIFSYQLLALTDKSFFVFYQEIGTLVKYEMIATALVVGLYMMQFEMRSRLEFTNKNLESIVTERTNELRKANEKLVQINEEVSAMNENLEDLVKQRTERMNHQLQQLNHFAYMNSHELRGPVARLLGLLDLFRIENSEQARVELVEKLFISGSELDKIIKRMNKLLEDDIDN